MLILHLCDRRDWEQAQLEGEYRPASLKTEGFIHASRPDQILGVANHFYRDSADLVLLVIESQRVQGEIRWELADGDTYPHIFGPINLDAIVNFLTISADADGVFRNFPPL